MGICQFKNFPGSYTFGPQLTMGREREGKNLPYQSHYASGTTEVGNGEEMGRGQEVLHIKELEEIGTLGKGN